MGWARHPERSEGSPTAQGVMKMEASSDLREARLSLLVFFGDGLVDGCGSIDVEELLAEMGVFEEPGELGQGLEMKAGGVFGGN